MTGPQHDRLVAARMPPKSWYVDEAAFEAQRRLVFARSWQYLCDTSALPEPGAVAPCSILPGMLDEPVVLTAVHDVVRCLSNVCTHRANVLVRESGTTAQIRCGYHGRRFALDGRVLHSPGFDHADDFPRRADDLPRLELSTLGPLVFAQIGTELPFDEWLGPVTDRVGWLPLDDLRFDTHLSRSYEFDAHWLLYCENYLEGLHIPFVHRSLAAALDVTDYTIEAVGSTVLQRAAAADGVPAFEPPEEHPDVGKRVAAYYFFVFPNLMLNFYPWGLSLNHVEPLGRRRTRVHFRHYAFDASSLPKGAGADLDQVELEDEAVVEAVQRGVESVTYRGGRYAPSHELGLFHVHELMRRALGERS